MKLRTAIYSAVATSSLIFSAGAGAQTATTVPSDMPSAAQQAAEAELASEDQKFLENAAQSGHMEIEGSKLAQTHATNADVKAFAERMIKDHTAVAEELTALAQSKGYTPPSEPSLMQKAELKTLDLRDDSFDAKYAEKIGVSAHEDAVELFRKASTEVRDPDIKAFAAKTLPALEEHLKMAQELHQKVVQTK